MQIVYYVMAILAGAVPGDGHVLAQRLDAANNTAEPPGAASDAMGEDVVAQRSPTAVGWTNWASDEEPLTIAKCASGSLVAAFQCSGGSCDNVSLLCLPQFAQNQPGYWTDWFSEEGAQYGANVRFCNDKHWMTGISCSGGWCDNIRLYCQDYPDLPVRSCFWSAWISEENGGTLNFPPGYFARGAACDGGNCDNMSFYLCHAG